MASNEPTNMTCSETQHLLDSYLAADPALTAEERETFEAHLAACPSCAHEYEASKTVISLLRKHWTVSPDTLALVEEAKRRAAIEHETPVQEQHRADQRLRFAFTRRSLGRIGRAAAIAASIMLLVGMSWLAVSQMRRPDVARSDTEPTTVAQADVPAPLTVERITPTGKQTLALNEPITSGQQPQELLIAGMHRVVMNTNTTATIRSVENVHTSGGGGEGCEIQLAKGELYVEVVPGHPFEVTTPNARLTITGTKFNVRTAPAPGSGQTDLTLLKGSVRLAPGSSDWGEAVHVTAGYSSTVKGHSAPTPPQQTDPIGRSGRSRTEHCPSITGVAGCTRSSGLRIAGRDCS